MRLVRGRGSEIGEVRGSETGEGRGYKLGGESELTGVNWEGRVS